MHFRWLWSVAVALVVIVQCLVVPVSASLKEMDEFAFNAWIRGDPPANILVLLYEEDSTESQQAEEIIEAMANQGEITQLIPETQVMKQRKGGAFTVTFGIKTFPTLVLCRDETTAFYTGQMDSDQIFFWLEKAGPSKVVKVLTDDTFEHLTQASTGSTTGHWAVLFYRPSCNDHFAILESLGINEKLWMSVAVVDVDENPKLLERFRLTSCPELIYFREGKMYRYETKKYDLPSVTSFVKSWYRNVKASVVPVEPTAFDALTETIAMYLKVQLEGENRTFTLAIIGGFAVTIVLTSVFCCLTGGSDSKQKKE